MARRTSHEIGSFKKCELEMIITSAIDTIELIETWISSRFFEMRLHTYPPAIEEINIQANTVITSAHRVTGRRQVALTRRRMAEIRVPACKVLQALREVLSMWDGRIYRWRVSSRVSNQTGESTTRVGKFPHVLP